MKGYEIFFFRKIWCALISCYLRFELRPFALSPTSSAFEEATPALSQVDIDIRQNVRIHKAK